jgi:NDP-sugar pyrophosphorylase family protein
VAPLSLRRRGRGPRVRALVLAAGYGTRLAPLTDALPKPLLPVRGRTLVELTLERLARAGCEAAAVNLHHLGGAIRDRLGESYHGLPLTYSEEPEILGTLGALAPLKDFFAGCDAVVVVNGDSLCRWPIARLLRRHRARGAAATLLFAAGAPPALYGGGVAIDRDGRVVSFRREPTAGGKPAPVGRGEPAPVGRGKPAPVGSGADAPAGGPGPRLRRRVFAGAHVLAPELLARAPERFSHVVHDLWEPLLGEGAHIEAVTTRRPWYDLGTPRRLRDAAIEGGAGFKATRWLARTWVAAGARVDRAARLRRSVVEAGAEVAVGARLRHTLLLPGARVGAGAALDGCVVGFGAEVPPEARVRQRLICRRTAGGSVPEGSSIVGGLVYAPLDPAPAAGAGA